MKKIVVCCMILVCMAFTACATEDKKLVNTGQSSDQGKLEIDNIEENRAETVIEDDTEPEAEDKAEPPTEPTEERASKEEVQNGVIRFDLNEDDSKRMQKADGWSNGSVFDCTWRGSNISFQDGIMRMKLDSDGENASPKWSGGEYRTRDFYHYGKYEVRMKPIKNDGVVSSFFVYTGPSDNNPWDEVDIEFLGKDTTKIQFNYYCNGGGGHEYIYDLGFDASEDFHTYGFEWREDSITWYVDGIAVYTATEDIPATPGKIMMNVWPGIGVDGWLKPFDGKVPLEAQYDWFQFTK